MPKGEKKGDKMDYSKEIIRLRKKQEGEQNKLSKELIPKYKKEWIGRCFKYKNCYSCPKTDRDYWWLYAKVTGIDGINFFPDGKHEPNFKMLTFQRCSMKTISFEISKFNYRFDGWNEVSLKQFNTQYNKMLELLKKQI